MSVTSHLKDLLTKMGGTPKVGDSTSVLIDKIEDVYDSSGSGGGESDVIFKVNILLDESSATPRYKFDKTVREIFAAIADNKSVYACYSYLNYPAPIENDMGNYLIGLPPKYIFAISEHVDANGGNTYHILSDPDESYECTSGDNDRRVPPLNDFMSDGLDDYFYVLCSR